MNNSSLNIAPESLSLSREQMLLRQQFSPMQSRPVIPRPEPPKQRTTDDLSEELLFQFGYVPFVIAEVAWDYIDTIFDLISYLNLSDLKKFVRSIKNIRRDYQSLRRSVYNGSDQHEEDNMLVFLDELKTEFSSIYQDVYQLVNTNYPDRNDDYNVIVACAYVAMMVYSALFSYVYHVTQEVQEFVGHKVGSILPPHLEQTNKILTSQFEDAKLQEQFKPIKEKYVKQLVKNIHSIKLEKD